MALKGHLYSGGLVGPLATIESGLANDLVGFDGSAVASTRSLTNLLDAVIGNTKGTILKRGTSAWEKLDPADGYLKSVSGVLSWTSVTAPPKWQNVTGSPFTISGNQDVTGLSGYQAIRVIPWGVTSASAGTMYVVVSTDNGSTFLTSSGDYLTLTATTGAATNADKLFLQTGTSVGPAYGFLTINDFSLTGPHTVNNSVLTQTVATTTALNAISFRSTSVSGMNGGLLYVQGLPGS